VVASSFKNVIKLGSLAIMLGVEDWELEMRDCKLARLYLAEKAIKKEIRVTELVKILKQPATPVTNSLKYRKSYIG